MRDDDKWDTAVDAIDDLTLAFDSAVRFGLSYFPTDGECRTDNGVLKGVAPNNGAEIRGELDRLGEPNQGATPLAGAINTGREYFLNLNDTNRNNVIILITDGNQSPVCNGGGNPVNRAREAFQAGFPVYVISFGRGATDTQTLRGMASEGGTNDYYQADDANALVQSLIDIIQVATSESCDGQDNDCDGIIDEGIPAQPCETNCGRGEKICVDGQLSVCTGGDIPIDICDGEDNDCDGQTDEVEYNECTTPSGNPGVAQCLEGGVLDDDCIPDDLSREEVCDGRDNNGNGEIDENTDEPCSIGCHDGWRRCVEGVLLNCSAPPVLEYELCNGYDDDCDPSTGEEGTCTGDEVCSNSGECLVPCTNGECFGDFVCSVENICVRRDCPSACGPGERCVDQQCITPCLSDSQCGAGDLCDPSTRRCIPDDRAVGGAEAGAEAGGMSAGGSQPIAGDVAGAQAGGTETPGGSTGGGSPAGFIPAEPGPDESEPAPAMTSEGASCQATSRSTALWLALFMFVIALRRRAV